MREEERGRDTGRRYTGEERQGEEEEGENLGREERLRKNYRNIEREKDKKK